MIPKVLVLLATYNGEKYLKPQLDSILEQKCIDVYIKIADDKSTDNTISIIKEYQKKYKNIIYSINNKTKGFTNNFIDLIFDCSKDYDYYAISDQDDVWLENKIINGIDKIKNIKDKNGCLYCSNLTEVNEKLEIIKTNVYSKNVGVNKLSFLVNNIATGSTIIFNNKFLIHVLKHYPENIYLHDYWLLLIAAFTASYYYDNNAYTLYRQHDSNLIGYNNKPSLCKRINDLKARPNKTSRLIQEFIKNFKNDIYPEDLKHVELVANYTNNFKDKLKLLFSRKINRRKYKIIFKIKVLLNKH